MFRFKKTLDVLTVFHSPTSPVSTALVSHLKAALSSGIPVSPSPLSNPTPKSSSSSSPASPYAIPRSEHKTPVSFELDIVTDPPTPDQLRSIMDYVGREKMGEVMEGARSVGDAVKRLQEGGDVRRPVLVDWSNGKAVVGGEVGEVERVLEGVKA